MAIGLFFGKVGDYLAGGFIAIGKIIGKINTALLLGLIYYLVLTPVGLLRRLGKQDSMQNKAPKNSNWKSVQTTYTHKDIKNPW